MSYHNSGSGLSQYIKNFLAAGGLLAIIGFAWSLSSSMTNVRDGITELTKQEVVNYETTNKIFSQQLEAFGLRLTSLEKARDTTTGQLSDTASSIAVLRAQTAAMQGTVQDMSQNIRSIQADISSMARTANQPLTQGRK